MDILKRGRQRRNIKGGGGIDDNASFIQVYAICVGGTGETPAQAFEAQEGSPQ